MSFALTSAFKTVSSSVVNASATASLTGLTVIVTVTVSVVPLTSVTVYVKVSSPAKSGAGVYSNAPLVIILMLPPLSASLL